MQPAVALLGRERELEECRALLVRARCLWIRGAPGLGKSALARALLAPAGQARTKRKTPVLIDDADGGLREAEARFERALGEREGPLLIVTARSRPSLANAPVHVVRPLGQDDTRNLLFQRMQALVPGWEVRTAGEDEWAVLSDRLEGSPLATEIVATLLRDHAISDVLSFTDNLDVVSMRAARQPAHHASFAEAVRWQLELLPRAIRDALVCVAVFRTRVGYELLLRAVQEMGVADARLTLTTLLDASLLETAERSPHRWMSRWVAQAVLAIESPELRERAQAIHARVVSTAAQDHMRRGKSPVTRVLSSEELAAAALHLPSGAPEDADVPWVRSLLDDVEVGLSTRDDPEAVAKFVETLPEFLPAAHPLAGAARFARAGRRLVSGERTAEPELAPGGAGTDDEEARRELFRARSAWIEGALGGVEQAVERGLVHARRAGLFSHVVALLTARGAGQALGGLPEAATASLEQALEEAMAVDDDALVAHVELRLGGLAAELGRVSEATVRLEQARTLALRAGHGRLAWLAELDLAGCLLEDGRFEEAAAATAACQARARPEWRGATVHFYRAVAEELAGRPVEASRTYVRALLRARQTGNRLIEAMVHAARARLSADHDELASAERSVAQAEAMFADLDDPTHGALAELSRGHLDLARARVAPPRDAASLRASVEACLARHRGAGGAAQRSFDVRIAARRLFAVVETQALASPPAEEVSSTSRRAGPPTPARPHAAACIEVERTGRWFQLPFNERVSLGTRGALRRILAGLSADRLERPGRTRSPEEVFAIGWPGQRCHPESAQARVYVAISSLRKLGLRDVIRRAHDGYFVDPDQELLLVDGGF